MKDSTVIYDAMRYDTTSYDKTRDQTNWISEYNWRASWEKSTMVRLGAEKKIPNFA